MEYKKIRIISWYGINFYRDKAVVAAYRNMLIKIHPELAEDKDSLDYMVKEFEDEIKTVKYK
jgi:glutamine amidotransferase PdxT